MNGNAVKIKITLQICRIYFQPDFLDKSINKLLVIDQLRFKKVIVITLVFVHNLLLYVRKYVLLYVLYIQLLLQIVINQEIAKIVYSNQTLLF